MWASRGCEKGFEEGFGSLGKASIRDGWCQGAGLTTRRTSRQFLGLSPSAGCITGFEKVNLDCSSLAVFSFKCEPGALEPRIEPFEACLRLGVIILGDFMTISEGAFLSCTAGLSVFCDSSAPGRRAWLPRLCGVCLGLELAAVPQTLETSSALAGRPFAGPQFSSLSSESESVSPVLARGLARSASFCGRPPGCLCRLRPRKGLTAACTSEASFEALPPGLPARPPVSAASLLADSGDSGGSESLSSASGFLEEEPGGGGTLSVGALFEGLSSAESGTWAGPGTARSACRVCSFCSRILAFSWRYCVSGGYLRDAGEDGRAGNADREVHERVAESGEVFEVVEREVEGPRESDEADELLLQVDLQLEEVLRHPRVP